MARKPLEEHLAHSYSFDVIADPDGGYVIRFPDLPGCMTQVEDAAEIPAMAEEARTLWIETEYDLGHDIPLPSYSEEYSGKFNVRLPRWLHRSLAKAASRNNVSLNHYVSNLLARGDAQAQIEEKLERLTGEVGRRPRPPDAAHVRQGVAPAAGR